MRKKIRILQVSLASFFAAWVLTAGVATAQNVLLDESDSLANWKNLAAETGTVKEGKVAGLWQGADKGTEASWNAEAPRDLRGLRSITFWMHSAVNNGADYAFLIATPGPNGAGDYFYAKLKVDWQGWKQVRVNASALIKSREADLAKVTRIAFVSKGWGAEPKADSKWILDRVELQFPASLRSGFAPAEFTLVPLADERLIPFESKYRLSAKAYMDLKAEPLWTPTFREPKPMTAADIVGPDGIVYPDFKYAGVQGGIPKTPVVVNAEDFGAKENEDIYPALKKAVEAAAKKGGGAILIKAGHYFIDRPLLITNSRIVFRGEGTNKTILTYRGGLRTKEVRLLYPEKDGDPIGMNKSYSIEAQADCDNMKEIRLIVGGQLVGSTPMAKLETGRFRVRSSGTVLKLSNVGEGLQEVRVEVDWRDGTQSALSRKAEIRSDLPDTGSVVYPDGVLYFQGPGIVGDGVSSPLASDARRGDFSVEVLSNEGFAVGDYVTVSAEPVPAFIQEIRSAYSRTPRIGGFVIASIKGHTIYLNQPLRLTFPVLHGAKLTKRTPLSFCGVESLTIDGTDPKGKIWNHGVGGYNLMNCFLKDVAVIKAGRNPIQFDYSKFCEVRDCHFSDAWFKDGGGTAYVFWEFSWDCLMDGIRGSRLRHAPNFQWSASGCVIRNGDFVDSDAQFHCGYAYENLMENCTLRSKQGNGSYGFGIYTQQPEADTHGPLGPRNVVWNCDVESDMPAVWCGGSTEAWTFAYNRLFTKSGPSIFAKAGCFDYTIRGNHLITADPDFWGSVYLGTPDCTGWWIEGNVFYGPTESLVSGMARAEKLKNNKTVPSAENAARPATPVASLFEWQRAQK